VAGARKGWRSILCGPRLSRLRMKARDAKTDCLVILGAGTLTDGAKIVALV
jgi:glycerol dehydrogenase-like iron-containing ADH family enzyme